MISIAISIILESICCKSKTIRVLSGTYASAALYYTSSVLPLYGYSRTYTIMYNFFEFWMYYQRKHYSLKFMHAGTFSKSFAARKFVTGCATYDEREGEHQNALE